MDVYVNVPTVIAVCIFCKDKLTKGFQEAMHISYFKDKPAFRLNRLRFSPFISGEYVWRASIGATRDTCFVTLSGFWFNDCPQTPRVQNLLSTTKTKQHSMSAIKPGSNCLQNTY